MNTRACPHHVVSASAGTGKTYRLAVHYLRLLRGGAAPQTIIATTFTRKAAGEILARVLSRLASAALGSDPRKLAELGKDLGIDLDAAHCRQMLAALAQNLHRVGIGTIDSFFNRAVQAFALDLGISSGGRVVAENDPLAQQLRWQALEAVLADEDLPDLLTLLRRLLKDSAGHNVADELDSAVCNFYAIFEEAPQAEAWSALELPARLLDPAQLAQTADRFAQFAAQPCADKRLGKALATDLMRLNARDWPTLIETGLFSRIAQGESTYYKKPLPPDVLRAYEPLVGHAQAVLLDQVSQRGRAAWQLLARFDLHYRRLRRRRHLLLFSDLAGLLARAALQTPDLYYRLDARVQHLLLDEFQDTSRLQWRVLRPLAEELTSHADGQRSFFCVGDPKQAIYAWRGGCAGLFDELRRDLPLPAQAFSLLDTSYRSSPVVLDAVNRVFRGLPGDPALAPYPQLAQTWARDFPTHKAHHRDLPGHVVLKTLCAAPDCDDTADPHDDTAASSAPSFLEKVADYVRHLVQQHPNRSLGVLLRQNRNLSTLIFLLRTRGLSVSGEGGNPLGDDSAVNLILSALRFADHPGDQPSAFHLLHSPLAPFLPLTSLDCAHLDAVALRLRRRLIDEGYAAVLSDWWRRIAPCLDLRNAQRLQQLIALADSCDAEPSLRPDLFARYVREKRVEEPTPAAVRIMTIHGAKGLEFDAVVLPELEGLLCKGDFSHLVERDKGGTPTAVFAAASQDICSLSPQLQSAYAAAEAQQVQDELCALYVAMTRAKFALHMLIKPLGKQPQGGVSRDRRCPANILRRALGPQDEPDMREQILYQAGDPHWHQCTSLSDKPAPPPLHPVRLRLLARTDSPPAPRFWPRVAPSSLADAGRVTADRLVAPHDSPALQLGSLVHRWMRLVSWLDTDPLPTDEQLRCAARDLGFFDPAALAEAIAAFRRTLNLAQVCAALLRPAGNVELWRERPFAVRVDGQIFSGAFDRVVLAKRDGRIHGADLWDFKTDRVDPQNLATVAERYRPQLAAYRQALAVLLNLPPAAITTKLLFLTTGDVCDLSLNPNS